MPARTLQAFFVITLAIYLSINAVEFLIFKKDKNIQFIYSFIADSFYDNATQLKFVVIPHLPSKTPHAHGLI